MEVLYFVIIYLFFLSSLREEMGDMVGERGVFVHLIRKVLSLVVALVYVLHVMKMKVMAKGSNYFVEEL